MEILSITISSLNGEDLKAVLILIFPVVQQGLFSVE